MSSRLIVEPTAGEVWFGGDGVDLCALSRRALAAYRPRMQMIFQDPNSSLNPRMSVGDIVGEPLKVNGADLSLDHGYPARLIVPALPGVHNTKWVSEIRFRES